MRTGSMIAASATFLALLSSPLALTIDPSRGVDPTVDYASLLAYGPWDDRNYRLTASDVALLGPGEDALPIAIPLFYRVELRRQFPDLPTSGPLRYPRSALQYFRGKYGGYRIDGRIYRELRNEGGRLAVDLSSGGVDEPTFLGEQERFLNGEVRLTDPRGAAESAIKVSPVDPTIVVAGVNGPVFGQEMFYSDDGGESWTKSTFPTGQTCCDPTVDYSSDGRFVYTASLPAGFGGIPFFRSADFGRTWDDLPGGSTSVGSGFVDKEFIHVDKHPSSPHVDNIYMTWQVNAVLQFAWSTDFGENWQLQAVSSGADELGIGSDIVTDKDGAVYYVWPAFNSRTILARKSLDGGVSFGPTRTIAETEASYAIAIPASTARQTWVHVAADADLSEGPYGNSVYVAWTDTTGPERPQAAQNHARIQVAYSRDGGESWTVTTPHEIDDADSVDRFNQWIAVAPDGSVHVVFYDTRRGERSSVDLFASVSTDGAQTWSKPRRVTSEVSPKIDDFFEWGDYNGVDAVIGNVIAVYTDNRNEAGGGADSVDVYTVGFEVSDSGLTLSLPEPGEAGEANAFEVTGATPGAETFLVFGLEEGAGGVPTCEETVAIDSPRVVGSADADASGTASIVTVVPAGAGGRTGYLAAVEIGRCAVSNVVRYTFR